ncbi:MAG TPA: hypothetical protein VIU62_12415 [Chloroflexota bacterium]|jgi:hypothetical protein
MAALSGILTGQGGLTAVALVHAPPLLAGRTPLMPTNPAYSQDQAMLYAQYPAMVPVGRLLRVVGVQAPQYGPQAKLLLATILEAAALTCLVAQETAILTSSNAYSQWATGKLWYACRVLAAAMRATAYSGSGTRRLVLSVVGTQALALFDGIDLMTMPSSSTFGGNGVDYFAQNYLGQGNQPARQNLEVALLRVLAGVTY